MPSVTSTVGLLPLPATVGAADVAIADPTETALLDYASFWIKWALDPKIATMTVPGLATPGDMAPVANRYTNAPNAVYLARKLPALFLWWDGKATPQRITTVKTCVEREFSVLYVFARLVSVEQTNTYSGLMATVEAALQRAFDRLAHPAYALAGSGWTAGTDIRRMFSLRGVQYLGGQEGFLKELAQESMRNVASNQAAKAQGGIQSGYPSLSARIRTWEEIKPDSLLDSDLTGDIVLDMNLGDVTNKLPFADRVLVAPDGSEQDDPDQVGK